MVYYTTIKKKELLPFARAWADIEIIMLSKISQSKKDKYQMISLIIWNLMNKITNLKQAHRYREQTDSCQRGGGELR